MLIALASPPVALSWAEGFHYVEQSISQAAEQGVEIVCFPEAYLPGLHGVDIQVLDCGPNEEQRVLTNLSNWSRKYRIATIFGTQRMTTAGRQNVAVVFSQEGHLLGAQTKNQIAPSEDAYYVPGTCRRMFEVGSVQFGIAICHEGWRYPETVRWAATRGAKIVFHPQHTGSNTAGVQLNEFAASSAPYYEKAMICRSIENDIYFASVNYALQTQESATCLIDPHGHCQARLPYGQAGVLVQKIDIAAATGKLAARFAAERYRACD